MCWERQDPFTSIINCRYVVKTEQYQQKQKNGRALGQQWLKKLTNQLNNTDQKWVFSLDDKIIDF